MSVCSYTVSFCSVYFIYFAHIPSHRFVQSRFSRTGQVPVGLDRRHYVAGMIDEREYQSALRRLTVGSYVAKSLETYAVDGSVNHNCLFCFLEVPCQYHEPHCMSTYTHYECVGICIWYPFHSLIVVVT